MLTAHVHGYLQGALSRDRFTAHVHGHRQGRFHVARGQRLVRLLGAEGGDARGLVEDYGFVAIDEDAIVEVPTDRAGQHHLL